MNGTKILISVLALAVLGLAPASATERHTQFVTGPADGAPLDIALGYLDANKAELGLTAGDLADFAVSDQYTTEHNGVTHVYLQQRLNGVEVVNGLFNVNVMPDGRILNFGNRFVGGLADAVNTQSAAIEHEDAIVSAARHLGLEVDRGALRIVEAFGGAAEKIAVRPGRSRRDRYPGGAQVSAARRRKSATRLEPALRPDRDARLLERVRRRADRRGAAQDQLDRLRRRGRLYLELLPGLRHSQGEPLRRQSLDRRRPGRRDRIAFRLARHRRDPRRRVHGQRSATTSRRRPTSTPTTIRSAILAPRAAPTWSSTTR